jgi:hypothetical protein
MLGEHKNMTASVRGSKSIPHVKAKVEDDVLINEIQLLVLE